MNDYVKILKRCVAYHTNCPGDEGSCESAARAILKQNAWLLERVSDLECVSRLKEVLEGCEHKARIATALVDFNPKVDALVSYCGCCGDRVPFDVLVPDTLWSQIPEKHRPGVLCLSCVDHLLPQGLDPALIRIVYASTSRGTTALVPVKALRGE